MAEPRPSPAGTVRALLAGLLGGGLLGWAMAGLPAPCRAQSVRQPPASIWARQEPLRASWQTLLFAQLEEGDRSWLPRLQRLPDGRVRYVYRRRQGDPPLSLAQIQALLQNPPRYGRERQAIGTLLTQLERIGIRVQLAPLRRPGAAGEWEPRSASLRIRPDVASRGSRDFAIVLNHEAIHVAQSCRAGGLRALPRPLGLARHLAPASQKLLASNVYAGASPSVRLLEEEAFAHQDDLGLGAALLARHCGTDDLPGRLGP